MRRAPEYITSSLPPSTPTAWHRQSNDSFNIFSYYKPEEHYPVTVTYRLTETGDVLHSAGEHTATLPKAFANYFKVRLVDDDVDEADSTVTITILPGPRYHVGTLSSYTFKVTDDDD